jgi:CubicO group peptidase (beta-lactamase class C family)
MPASWVAESTQKDTSFDSMAYYPKDAFFQEKGYYRYFWWGLRGDDGESDFGASGHLGQFIYVSPQANLIIVPQRRGAIGCRKCG